MCNCLRKKEKDKNLYLILYNNSLREDGIKYKTGYRKYREGNKQAQLTVNLCTQTIRPIRILLQGEEKNAYQLYLTLSP